MDAPIELVITLAGGMATGRFPDRDHGWNAGEEISDSVVIDYDGQTGRMAGFTLLDFGAGAHARVPLVAGDVRGDAHGVGGATPWLLVKNTAKGLALWLESRPENQVLLRGFSAGTRTVSLGPLFAGTASRAS
jgi:hypothetical protein